MSGQFETGIARHSMHRIDPVEHLITRNGQEFRTWCGGGLAMESTSITRRRCRRCLALARRDLIENDVALNEPSDLDWYIGRTAERVEVAT